MERSPESLVYQGSLTRLNSFLVFGVRYKDCGVLGTTFIESSYDSSSLPSSCCRNKRNKTKRNLIWAFYLVPKHWCPGRVLSTLFKTDTTCVTSTKCPSREESSKVSKERQGQNSGCQLNYFGKDDGAEPKSDLAHIKNSLSLTLGINFVLIGHVICHGNILIKIVNYWPVAIGGRFKTRIEW